MRDGVFEFMRGVVIGVVWEEKMEVNCCCRSDVKFKWMNYG